MISKTGFFMVLPTPVHLTSDPPPKRE